MEAKSNGESVETSLKKKELETHHCGNFELIDVSSDPLPIDTSTQLGSVESILLPEEIYSSTMLKQSVPAEKIGEKQALDDWNIEFETSEATDAVESQSTDLLEGAVHISNVTYLLKAN